MTSVRALWVSLALGVAACAGGRDGAQGAGGAQAAAPEQSSAGGAQSEGAGGEVVAPVPLVPLRMRAGGGDGGVEHALELRADGGVYADNVLRGRFDGRVFSAEDGAEMFHIADDGVVTVPRVSGPRIRITPGGEIVGPGARIAVHEDGTIDEVHEGGRVERAPFRFDPIPPNGLRAAAAVVLATLIPRVDESAPRGSAVAPSMAEPAAATADAGVPPGLDAGASAGANGSVAASGAGDAGGGDAARRRRR